MTEESHGRHVAQPAFVVAGESIVSHDALVETDEATGTPPRISAETRTAVYVGALVFNTLCLLVFGLLPIFDILDPGKAAQAMNVVITAINLVSMGLAVGYRPTRSGSPVKP